MFENCVWNHRAPEGGHLFSVVLGGDVCPGSAGEEVVRAGRAAEVMKEVAAFVRSGDLRIVQWETPIVSHEAPISKSGPNLNSPPETLEILRAAGFDIALLANNHIGDQGTAGVGETMEQLHHYGFQTVGAGQDLADANRPLSLQAGGKSVVLFNFAENEFGIADSGKPGVAPLSPLRNLKQVREAAANGDFVIVTLHGGHEYNPFPSPRLQELCRSFADAGAKLVFNCHTHCPEGVEYYNGAQIVYSPGNFYFPRYNHAIWLTGYLVKCAFDRLGVYELELLPYRFDNDLVSPLKESERALFESYMERLCAPLADPVQLRKLFEAWSTMSGHGYLSSVLGDIPEGWRERFGEPEMAAKLLHLKNLFSCESHHDMIRCYLQLIEEGRVKEAAKLLPEIKSFETPEWMVRT